MQNDSFNWSYSSDKRKSGLGIGKIWDLIGNIDGNIIQIVDRNF